MTIKRFVLFTLSVVFLTTLVGCGIFAPQPTATPVPTATLVPTATSTPTEIPTPTPTATPAPRIVSMLLANSFTLDDYATSLCTSNAPCKVYTDQKTYVSVTVYDYDFRVEITFNIKMIDNAVSVDSNTFEEVTNVLNKIYGTSVAHGEISVSTWVFDNLDQARRRGIKGVAGQNAAGQTIFMTLEMTDKSSGYIWVIIKLSYKP